MMRILNHVPIGLPTHLVQKCTLKARRNASCSDEAKKVCPETPVVQAIALLETPGSMNWPVLALFSFRARHTRRSFRASELLSGRRGFREALARGGFYAVCATGLLGTFAFEPTCRPASSIVAGRTGSGAAGSAPPESAPPSATTPSKPNMDAGWRRNLKRATAWR